LTCREAFHRRLDRRHHLRLLEPVGRGGRDVGDSSTSRSRGGRARRPPRPGPWTEQRGPGRAYLARAEMVPDRVLQDPLEEQRQLRRGPSGYFSASRSIESWTMSRALCSFCTAKTACLKARRSTEARKSDISFGVARGLLLPRARAARMVANGRAAAPRQAYDAVPQFWLDQHRRAANLDRSTPKNSRFTRP
jgi:hypothetical protein